MEAVRGGKSRPFPEKGRDRAIHTSSWAPCSPQLLAGLKLWRERNRGCLHHARVPIAEDERENIGLEANRLHLRISHLEPRISPGERRGAEGMDRGSMVPVHVRADSLRRFGGNFVGHVRGGGLNLNCPLRGGDLEWKILIT